MPPVFIKVNYKVSDKVAQAPLRGCGDTGGIVEFVTVEMVRSCGNCFTVFHQGFE
jgi:hypothetical protein